MRPLEIIIPTFLLIYLLWPHPRLLLARLAPAAALVLTLVHFTMEGYRWQMIPLYVLTALLGISALIKIQSNSDWKPLASSLTAGLVLVSIVLPVLLPVPVMLASSGTYQVGTTIFDLKDDSRRELYSGEDESRKFVVQLWYPAEPQPNSQLAPWMEHAEIFAPALANYFHMPHNLLDYLTLVKAPAYKNVEVAKSASGFPVIIFSHGWKGFDAQNTAQMIELASHGYVTVAINHTYGAITTVFQDGTIAPNNPSALPAGAPDAEYDIAARKLVAQWAGDISFTLKDLNALNSDVRGPFFGAFDLSRVGVFGHSTGGGAAIEFCGRKSDCKAVLGLDPFMRPVSLEVLENGLSQPAFFMFSQAWADDKDSRNNLLFYPFYKKSKQPIGVVSINGAAHTDFTDLPMLSPIAHQLGLKGTVNGKQMVRIMNTYILAFFDQTLKGKPSKIFKTPSQKFPEVILIQ